jgi:hypothetical protein
MSGELSRRSFLKKSVAASAGAALGLGVGGADGKEGALPEKGKADAVIGAKGMPIGMIGKLTVSRLIAGGNLISGWAHARDLIYVHQLMRHYNTDEKVMDTLELLEENGVNTIVADPSERPYRIFPEYWKQRGGKIQWIAEGHPDVTDLKTDMRKSLDFGASAIYIQGVIGDMWLRSGDIDLLGKCMDFIRSQGVPAGIGAHLLEVIQVSEEQGYAADFYVKTLHRTNYWSARRPDQKLDVIENHTDNYWSMTPEKTIEFMKKVEKPWIAFKTLAAGAIHPRDGFRYAFRGGADFICVGMFDFQVVEDAILVKETLKGLENRPRPWRA